MNKLKSLAVFLLLTVSVVTCKQKAKEGDCIHEKAYLYISVKNNLQQRVDSAVINIFDSYDNFLRAQADKNNPVYALASYKSDSSSEVQIPVDPYVEHWILVSKYDSTQLKYLSSELTTSKMQKLQSCSDYHISVNLESVGATVAFWTPTYLNLNIKIQFNGGVDSLTGYTSIAPTSASSPGANHQLNYFVKAGTYRYQATAAGNCSWQGEITVTDGEFKTVELESCQRAVLAFYVDAASGITNSGPGTKFPITVYIDNSTTPAGKIENVYTGSTVANSCPGSPSAQNILYLYLEPGIAHTYKAVSAAGTTTPCIWTGTSNVLDPNCSLNPAIKLSGTCN
ncbi:MAG TPA: hypothetical protein VNB90_02860 [Cytophagaceae bacterium]|nr:hypothetical protein [Cytophagaceae bacterium]